MEEGTKRCPYCAEVIREEAIVCRFCNRDLAERPPKTQRNRRWILWLLLVGAALVALSVGASYGMAVIRRQSSPETTVRAFLDTVLNEQDPDRFVTQDIIVSEMAVASALMDLMVLKDSSKLALQARESRTLPGFMEVQLDGTYFVLERNWGSWYISCIAYQDPAPCYR